MRSQKLSGMAKAGRLTILLAILAGVSPSAVAETPILKDGHVDLGAIYSAGQLSLRFNADGATSEGSSPGNLMGLYAPSELYVRVPDVMRFSVPPFPGNPNVTGVGSGPIWLLPSSGGQPGVPFLGWTWDFGISSPPQLNLSQWQNGRVLIELVDAAMPVGGNVSIWLGGTNYVSTFNPSLTNAPNVPAGSNSFYLPSHNHFNWGFTAEGIYDLTVRASGVHNTDGFKSVEGTFRFLVGDSTLPVVPATVVNARVYHSEWTGPGSAVDEDKVIAKEGTGPQVLGLDNLISTSHGINGLEFTIMNLGDGSQLSADDFMFQWSPQGIFDLQEHQPSSWPSAPAPLSIQVTPGTPSQVLIQWSSGAIVDRWMRITLEATSSTGLAQSESYVVGHLRGETTGLADGIFTVSFADITQIRGAVGQSVTSGNTLDIDKNGTIAFGDISAMRENIGVQLSGISLP